MYSVFSSQMVWRSTIREMLPALYECSLDKEASVGSMLVSHSVGARRSWGVKFPRDFNDCELELITAFLSAPESNIPSREGH